MTLFKLSNVIFYLDYYDFFFFGYNFYLMFDIDMQGGTLGFVRESLIWDLHALKVS